MCFLIKKILMMTKNLNYMIDFLCQIEILQLKMLKLLKIQGFSRFFKISQIPGFFSQNCQIPGFSRFPDEVASVSREI